MPSLVSIVFALVHSTGPAVGTVADPDDVPPAAPPPTVELEAGLGQGVGVKTSDGAFGVSMRLRLQLRAAARVFEDDDGRDQLAPEFLARRGRIVFAGDALHRQVEFYVQLGIAAPDLEADLPVPLRDGHVTWHFTDAVGVRVGQMKVPFDRQRIVSSSALQFADRTSVVNELNLDRDIGGVVLLDPFADALAFQLGVFGGDGRNRPVAVPALLTSARVQWTPFGAFDDLVEGDLGRGDSHRLAVAAAVAFNAASTRVRSSHGRQLEDGEGSLDYVHATADAIWKYQGASVLVSVIGRQATGDGGAPEPIARSAVGGLAQVGYLIVDGLELVGRASAMTPTGMGPTNADDVVTDWEAALGANLAPEQHNLKLQLDGSFVGTGDGRPDLVARAQLQIFL